MQKKCKEKWKLTNLILIKSTILKIVWFDLRENVFFFVRKLEKSYEIEYYKNQLIRSSGSSSLNYGEAQGTITDKDFVFKVSLSVKELKESRNSLKVLDYIKAGDSEERKWLLTEVEELIAIASKMINNNNNKK